MRLFQMLLLSIVLALPARPEMPVEQKLFDFEYLTSLLAKWYAPYEWKAGTVGHDLYAVEPWIARIRASRSDL